MKTLFTKLTLLLSAIMVVAAGRANAKNIKTEEVVYNANGVAMHGMVAWDADVKGKRPAIVVVPEWWGITDYAKKRARMLAEQGYIAIAADMYGDGKIAADPKTAMEYAGPFYQDPKLGQQRIEAAIAKLKQYPETDSKRIAAIGYCFGGSMVLNAAALGTDLTAVVSFHGGLKTAPAAKGSVKGQILVCNGAADKFVPKEDIDAFRKNLDEMKVHYKFINYANATHAFTNPESTENGKKFNLPIAYNEAADKKSWNDMKTFFNETLK